MCLIRRFTFWHCGCAVDLKDQAMLKPCAHKVANPDAPCTIHVVPFYDNDAETGGGGTNTANTSNGGTGNHHHHDGHSGAASNAGNMSNGTTIPSIGNSGNGGHGNIGNNGHIGNIGNTGNIGNIGNIGNVGSNGSTTTNYSIGTISAGIRAIANADANGWNYHDWMYLVVPVVAHVTLEQDAETLRQIHTAPRMCAEHEAKFELSVHAYWKSELLWLRPKLCRHGVAARQNLVLAQQRADRLWHLYRLWKLFHGGDQHGSADITCTTHHHHHFPHHPWWGYISLDHEEYDNVDNSDAHSDGNADAGADADGITIEKVGDDDDSDDDLGLNVGQALMEFALADGETNYAALRMGLDDLLDPLRDSLHPREMVA
ncbi:hypothetical protein SPI_00120 [Niveomyces insectorum RCEF 264]|uniref:Uncharacterized protein n=1 Tax=Niveomyces insectorum RCEF 264 TaxID=1081102 RepID=A0A167ZUL4_9HYPO|nr:hypothetical protein SPI_00120 [Niveomyces insectorum RCEF 264]